MNLPRPLGIFVIAIFFAAATILIVTVGFALLFPGTFLEVVWSLYPARRALLMPYRLLLGPAFLLLSVAFAGASIGCLQHRKWGWWLAMGIFAVDGLGDAVQLAIGRLVEGGNGVAVAAAILFYLTRPFVRQAFTG